MDLESFFRTARSDPALAVLEGFHPLKHALRFGADIVQAVTADRSRLARLAGDLAPDVADAIDRLVAEVPPELFAALTPHPPASGVVTAARRPHPNPTVVLSDRAPGPVILLEAPNHLGNIGAVIRVAAAAGAAAVFTTGDRDPWHPAALRGSAGLHFALPVARIHQLDTADRPLVVMDPEGDPLGAAPLPARAVIAFGSERRGVSPALRARAGLRLAIPMRSGVSSLNLATTVAVVLFHRPTA